MAFTEIDAENSAEMLPGTGVVRMDVDILKEWILLPEGFEIVDARMEAASRIVTFTVKHKRESISLDGVEFPTFTPIFQVKCDDDGIAWHRLLKIVVWDGHL